MQVFLTGEAPAQAMALAKVLQAETVKQKEHDLKAFILLRPGDPAESELVKLNLPNVGVAVLDDRGGDALKLYKISSDSKVKNTVMIYEQRKVFETFVNLEATGSGVKSLSEAIDKMLDSSGR